MLMQCFISMNSRKYPNKIVQTYRYWHC